MPEAVHSVPRIEVLRGGMTAAPASRYVARLLEGGAAAYAKDARVELQPISVGGQVLAIVVNRGDERAAAWSPLSHYYRYPLEEFGKRHRLAGAAARALLSPVGAALSLSSFNRAIILNDRLFGSKRAGEWSAEEISALTACLRRECPDFVYMFRSLDQVCDSAACRALIDNGYRMVHSGRFYLLDGRQTGHLHHRNVRLDLKLLKTLPYEIVSCHRDLLPHAGRMAELYRKLNFEKYSSLNLQYTAEFFRLTLEENTLQYHGFVRNGRLDAFIAIALRPELMILALLGYEQEMEHGNRLYRAGIALANAEATEKKMMLNLGAGAAKFKILRGAVAAERFDAVYDRHLPGIRRLPWRALATACRWHARHHNSRAESCSAERAS
jgi:hypothetical protein